MPYQDMFVLFWEQVKESVQEGQFAKLTMAKTIGQPDLRNIFVRPMYDEDDFSALVKFRYTARDVEDTEEELTLNEVFTVVKSHLKNPFSSVLLFTTTKDVTFKINKKGAARIIENLPTFNEVTQAKRDEE